MIGPVTGLCCCLHLYLRQSPGRFTLPRGPGSRIRKLDAGLSFEPWNNLHENRPRHCPSGEASLVLLRGEETWVDSASGDEGRGESIGFEIALFLLQSRA